MGTIFQIGCVSAESAPKMIEAAVARANSIGVPQVVAILDESGLLKGFCRMDGAPLISIEVAQNKACTALLGTPSQDCFMTRGKARRDQPIRIRALQIDEFHYRGIGDYPIAIRLLERRAGDERIPLCAT